MKHLQYTIQYLLKRLVKYLKNHSITEKDIIILIRQLATLITAGIPLLQGLDLLIEMQHKEPLRSLVSKIRNDILSGKLLSLSLQTYPTYFTPFMCHLIHLGETTGRLDNLLLMLATQQEKYWEFKNSIKQALFYPLVITVTAFLVTGGMFIFIVPRFAVLFSATEIKLPAFTRALFYCASLFNRCMTICFILLLATFIYCHYHKRRILELGQWLLTTLPIITNYRHKIQLAQFTRHLALSYQAGVPLVQALALMVPAKHPSFATQIKKLQRQVASGKQLHHVMQQSQFPPLMVQLVKIGEESGKLEQMLYKTSDFFMLEVEQAIAYTLKLVEPLIMVILGVLIGGLVIGMYLPLFNLGNAL